MSDEAVRETLTDGEKEDLASQAGGRQVIRTREARIRSARDRVVRVARKLGPGVFSRARLAAQVEALLNRERGR